MVREFASTTTTTTLALGGSAAAAAAGSAAEPDCSLKIMLRKSTVTRCDSHTAQRVSMVVGWGGGAHVQTLGVDLDVQLFICFKCDRSKEEIVVCFYL